MSALELVRLTGLMARSGGSPRVSIGLIDGPVATRHPELLSEHLREITGASGGTCARAYSTACRHGTFIAGVLSAKRTAVAPAICPDCILLIRPIFSEAARGDDQTPVATPRELAAAIVDCIAAGARIINLSLALVEPSSNDEPSLQDALRLAVYRGVIIVAAAGNQSALGGSVLTRHPWVIPVVACDILGDPLNDSNLVASIGRRGLRAPGVNITSLGADGQSVTLGGTSVAVPFVTGALALLWSEFPAATATQIKLAMTRMSAQSRTSVIPPLLDAAKAWQTMRSVWGSVN